MFRAVQHVETVAALLFVEGREGSSGCTSPSLPVAAAGAAAVVPQWTHDTSPIDVLTEGLVDQDLYWTDNWSIDEFIHNVTGSRMEFGEAVAILSSSRSCQRPPPFQRPPFLPFLLLLLLLSLLLHTLRSHPILLFLLPNRISL
jgi:hypothetical protein